MVAPVRTATGHKTFSQRVQPLTSIPDAKIVGWLWPFIWLPSMTRTCPRPAGATLPYAVNRTTHPRLPFHGVTAKLARLGRFSIRTVRAGCRVAPDLPDLAVEKCDVKRHQRFQVRPQGVGFKGDGCGAVEPWAWQRYHAQSDPGSVGGDAGAWTAKLL